MLIKCEHLNMHGRIMTIMEDIHTHKKEIEGWKSNVITTVGKQAILRRLRNAGTYSNEGIITYGAVGTGYSIPSAADIQLVTEIARQTMLVSSTGGVILTMRVFFPAAEANGDLTEFAWFGEEASATINTGTMFNIATINKTKTSAKTLIVVQQFEWE